MAVYRSRSTKRDCLGRWLVCLLVIGLTVTLPALAVPDYSWSAGNPGGAPASSWDEDASLYAWSVGGASAVSPVSVAPGLTAAYRFDGGDVISGQSFQEFVSAGTPSLSTSFELWLRPSDLSGQEILFETGGGTDGLSFTLDGSMLQFRVKDSSANITLTDDLTPFMTSGEFIQIVGTVTLGSEASLYVNNLLRDVTNPGDAAGINDWAGNGDTGIGYRSGGIGGSVGGDLNSYDNFVGDVARVSFWEDYVLSQAEVTSRWD
jgi:hypothetical protein